MEPFGEIFGEILGLLSIQTVLISMELGSKNTITMGMKNKHQKNYIKSCLVSYLNHAVFAMFIMVIYMYCVYGPKGMMICMILNIIFIRWIYKQYADLIDVYIV